MKSSLTTKCSPEAINRHGFTPEIDPSRAKKDSYTRVRFKSEAKSETLDLNLVDDEGLSVIFSKVSLAGVNTVTLKDVNGKIIGENE